MAVKCRLCAATVNRYHDNIQCNTCKEYFHIECLNISIAVYENMKISGAVKEWICKSCDGCSITSNISDGPPKSTPGKVLSTSTELELGVSQKDDVNNTNVSSVELLIIQQILPEIKGLREEVALLRAEIDVLRKEMAKNRQELMNVSTSCSELKQTNEEISKNLMKIINLNKEEETCNGNQQSKTNAHNRNKMRINSTTQQKMSGTTSNTTMLLKNSSQQKPQESQYADNKINRNVAIVHDVNSQNSDSAQKANTKQTYSNVAAVKTNAAIGENVLAAGQSNNNNMNESNETQILLQSKNTPKDKTHSLQKNIESKLITHNKERNKSSSSQKVGMLQRNTNLDDNNWTTVTRKKKKITPICGKVDNSEIKGVAKKAHIHASRFNIAVTEKEIKDYLTKENFTGVEVIKVQSKYPDEYSSFKISTNADEIERLKAPELWGKGICIYPFFPWIKKRKDQG